MCESGPPCFSYAFLIHFSAHPGLHQEESLVLASFCSIRTAGKFAPKPVRNMVHLYSNLHMYGQTSAKKAPSSALFVYFVCWKLFGIGSFGLFKSETSLTTPL